MIALLLLLLGAPALAEAPPAVVHAVEPIYPPDARARGVEGTVVLALRLDAAGRVIDATIRDSAGDALDAAALDAAFALRFTEGAPDRSLAYAFTFRLSRSEVGGPPAPATLHGAVHDSDGGALGDAVVTLAPLDDPDAPATTLTANARGRFTAPFLSPGRWRVTIARAGFLPREFVLTLDAGQVVDGTFELPIDDALEIVIYGDRPTWREVDRGAREADESPQTGAYVLTRRDIETTPGSMEDVVRATHALPGVVSDGDLLAGVYVRGGDQSDVVYLLDGVPLDSPFHLAGYNSLFNPDMIESVRFYAGAAPADTPSGTSAVMEVQSWDGRPREPGGGFDGAIDLSAGAARAFVMGPIDAQGKLTFALAARRTFLEAYFQVLKALDVLDAAFAAPEFSELSGRLSWRPNDQHQTVFTVLRGGDSLNVVGADEEALVRIDGTFQQRSSLTLFSLSHTWTPQPGSRVRVIGAFTHDRSSMVRDLAGISSRDDRFDRVFGRIDATHGVGPLSLQAGGDVSGLTLDARGSVEDKRYLPTWTQAGLTDFGLPLVDLDARARWVEGAAYAQLGVVKGPIRARAGLRSTFSTLLPSGEPLLSPNLAVSVPLPTGTIPKLSWGLYNQLQRDPLILDPEIGSPMLGPERAEHLVFGLDQAWGVSSAGIVGLFRVEVYQIRLWDLVVGPDDPGTLDAAPPYTNAGSGTSRGLDVLAVARAGRWSGQIAWSVLKALRTNPRNTVFDETVAPPQDQRHTLTLLGDWQAFPHWRFTARYGFHPGRPVSRVAPASETTAALTCLNCDRLGPTHQLDLRAEWRRAYRGYRLAFYLEVLNVGNVRSPFLPIHTVQDGALATSTLNHLPMRPFVGLRVDF